MASKLPPGLCKHCSGISAGREYDAKPGFGLREFADGRYEAKEDFLHPVGAEKSFQNGCYQELEGTYPGETEPTYYVMGAVALDSGFVSFSIVTTRTDFEQHREKYVDIMQSSQQA